jgi:hypothetical protein
MGFGWKACGNLLGVCILKSTFTASTVQAHYNRTPTHLAVISAARIPGSTPLLSSGLTNAAPVGVTVQLPRPTAAASSGCTSVV